MIFLCVYLKYSFLLCVVFLRHRQKKKQSLTLNHKPQVGPQHRHHHDEVRKNGISYAVGLMRSIAYRRIRLVNRKTAMAFKPSTNVGFASNREDQSYVAIDFLAK